jgi:hypothetical protein
MRVGDGAIKALKQRSTMVRFVFREVTGGNLPDGLDGGKDWKRGDQLSEEELLNFQICLTQ